MGICNQCKHFRDAIPLSELLRSDIGATIFSAVSDELTKIREQEQKLQDLEAQIKNQQQRQGSEEWPTCPRMSDFCGLRESQSVYLISEIKNRGGSCTDFAPGLPPKRSCRDCEYQINPQGDVKDAQILIDFSHIANFNTIAGGQGSLAGGFLSDYNQTIGPRKAQEMKSAYHSKEYLLKKPEYLHYCEKLSTIDDDENSTNNKFVICVLQNPHETCSAWKKGANPSRSSQSPGSSQGQNPTGPTSGSKILDGFRGAARWLGNTLQQQGSTPTAHPPSTIPHPPPPPSVTSNKPWQFEALQQQYYEHPNGGYKIVLDQATLRVYGPAQLRLIYPMSDFPTSSWKELRIGKINLPLRVRREGQGRLFVEWL